MKGIVQAHTAERQLMSIGEHGTILVLGENPFQPSPEIVSLQYLPSLCQVQSLEPEIVVVNLKHKPKTEIAHLLRLCEEIEAAYGKGLPVFGIYEDHSQLASSKFVRSWQATVEHKLILDEIISFLRHDRSQKQVLQTLETLNSFKQSVNRELERASVFQEALFSNSLKKTNLEFHYHYYFSQGISGSFVRFFSLSASHTALFMGEVKGQGMLAGLLTGFILGQLHAIEEQSASILWQPDRLLEYLSQAIYEHNNSAEFYVKAWYGIFDLTTGGLDFVEAGLQKPSLFDQSLNQVKKLEADRQGFPLGMFPHLSYRQSHHSLALPCRMLFCSESPANSSNNWLDQIMLTEIDKPVINLLAQIDTHYTDISSQNEEDRLIMVLELKKTNQTYLNIRELEIDQEDIFETQDHQIPLTIDMVTRPLAAKIEEEVLEELQLGLEELLSAATRQLQKTRLMHPHIAEPKGFLVTWWTHVDSIDVSVRLDEGAIPWSYSPEQKYLDIAISLMLFFDNIQVNSSGLEISMTKSLALKGD